MKTAKDFVPYLNITTHLDTSPDQELLQAKGGNGFPTLFFFEPETGAVLNDWWWPQDEKTVRDAHAAARKKADELIQLVRKAEKKPDDAALQAELQIRLALMRASERSLDELIKLGEVEGVDTDLLKEFRLWVAVQRVQKVFEDARERATTREELDAAVRAGMYALLQQGVRLDPSHELAEPYYDAGLDAAVEKKDRAIAQAAFEGYRDALGSILERYPRQKEQVEERIEKARKRLESVPKE